ncbi:MAG: hypothetical protein ABEK42_00040 [Thiohalorhabdaceae bacterium]
MIGTIAGREFRTLFLSPLAWTLLAVVQVIVAYLFLAQLDRFQRLAPRLGSMEGAPGISDLVIAPTFANSAVILLLVIPLITMRLTKENRSFVRHVGSEAAANRSGEPCPAGIPQSLIAPASEPLERLYFCSF